MSSLDFAPFAVYIEQFDGFIKNIFTDFGSRFPWIYGAEKKKMLLVPDALNMTDHLPPK